MFLPLKSDYSMNKKHKFNSIINYSLPFPAMIHYLFQLNSTKNMEKAYFDQHLENAAPKRCLKYTTVTT